MANDVLLLWFTTLLSGVVTLLAWKGILKNWPKISIVSFTSNVSMMLLYYSPLSGMNYYLANVIKIELLIMMLVVLAGSDKSFNWSYRAMCWILILQIFTNGLHMWNNLDFVYFDQFILTTTILEILLLLLGGLNVRFTRMGKLINRVCGTVFSSPWAKRNL